MKTNQVCCVLGSSPQYDGLLPKTQGTKPRKAVMILSKMSIEDSFVCTIEVNGVENQHGTSLTYTVWGKKANYPCLA